MPSELSVAANGSDKSITAVYELNQRPVPNRVTLPDSLLTTKSSDNHAAIGVCTSLDSEIAIDRTADSRPVVIRSWVFAPQ